MSQPSAKEPQILTTDLTAGTDGRADLRPVAPPRKKILHAEWLQGIICASLFTASRLLIIRYGGGGEAALDLILLRRLAEGKVLLRDFLYPNGPLPLYINYLVVQMLGWEELAIRFANTLIAAVGVYWAYRIAREWMPPVWSMGASLLAFSLWTFPAFTYLYTFHTVMLMGGLWLLLSHLRDPREALVRRRFLALGGVVGILLLSKPFSLGIITFFAILGFLAVTRQRWWRVYFPSIPWVAGTYVAGAALGLAIPYYAWLATQAPLTRIYPTFNVDMYYRTLYPPQMTYLLPVNLARIQWGADLGIVSRDLVVLLFDWWGVVLFWVVLIFQPLVTVAVMAYRVGSRKADWRDASLLLLAWLTPAVNSQILLTGITASGTFRQGTVMAALGLFTMPIPLLLSVTLLYRAAQAMRDRDPRLGRLSAGTIAVVLLALVMLPSAGGIRSVVQGGEVSTVPYLRGMRPRQAERDVVVPTATYIRQHTGPKDTFFILGWVPMLELLVDHPMLFPEFYGMMDHPRPEAILGPWNFPHWEGPPMRADDFVRARFERVLPPVVVAPVSFEEVRERYPKLAPILEARYEIVKRFAVRTAPEESVTAGEYALTIFRRRDA